MIFFFLTVVTESNTDFRAILFFFYFNMRQWGRKHLLQSGTNPPC